MANFFQPGDAKGTETATPSPAAQARAKYNADILGKILEFAAGRQRPSFAQYAQGASMPGALPAGLSAGIPDLLAAMNQPGAFTATRSASGHGPTGSMASDIASALGLADLVYNSGALNGLGKLAGILAPVGGALSIGNVPSADLSGASSADANVLGSLGALWGDQGQVPMAGAGGASEDLLSSILSSNYWY